MIPIVCVVGKSDSGKTTLLEKLIVEFKQRGYRVATIKHHSHGDFDIDVPGKDTWRHAQAGADQVVIASPSKLAHIRRLEHELSLDEIVASITGVDIILTEGFKRSAKPKIEVSRCEQGSELICQPEELIAVAADHPINVDVPQFGLNDAAGIVDLLVANCLRATTGTDSCLK